TVPLTQSAPGRYEGQFLAKDEGAYFLEVVQKDDQGKVVSSQPGGYVVPYSAEYRDRQPNQRLLDGLTRSTGGMTMGDPAASFRHDQPAPGQPLEAWPVLLALAALLFMLDVAGRRLRLAWADVRPLLRRARHAWAQRPALGRGVPLIAARRAAGDAPGLPRLHPATTTQRPTVVLPPPDTVAGRSARLLQAKRRARASSQSAEPPAPPPTSAAP